MGDRSRKVRAASAATSLLLGERTGKGDEGFIPGIVRNLLKYLCVCTPGCITLFHLLLISATVLHSNGHLISLKRKQTGGWPKQCCAVPLHRHPGCTCAHMQTLRHIQMQGTWTTRKAWACPANQLQSKHILLSPSPRAPLRKWAVCSGEPLPQQFAWRELYLNKDPSVTTNVQRSTIVSLGWVWSKLPHFAWVVSTSCLWKANNRSLNCTAARSYRVHPVSQKLSLMAFQVTYGILSHP